MDTLAPSRTAPDKRDYWQAFRLLSVFLAFGFWVHLHLKYGWPTPRQIANCVASLWMILMLCALISEALVYLFASIVMFPFRAAAVLNRWIYAGNYWLVRTILRLLYMRRVAALLALAGEIGIFVCLWFSIEAILKR